MIPAQPHPARRPFLQYTAIQRYTPPVTSKKGVIGIGVPLQLHDASRGLSAESAASLSVPPVMAARMGERKLRRFPQGLPGTPTHSSCRPRLASGAVVFVNRSTWSPFMAKAAQGERARAHTPNHTPTDHDDAPEAGSSTPPLMSLAAMHRSLRMAACFAPAPGKADAWSANLSRSLVEHIDQIDQCVTALREQACALEYLAGYLLPTLQLTEFEHNALRGLLVPMAQRTKAAADQLDAAMGDEPATQPRTQP